MKKFVLLLLALAISFTAAALLTRRADQMPLLPTVSPFSPLLNATATPKKATVAPALTTPPVLQTEKPTPSPASASTSTPLPTPLPPSAKPTEKITAAPTIAPTATVKPTAEPLTLPAGTPDFTFTASNGETKKLSDFLGKPIVLNFWASWCVPCQSELPAFQEAYDLYGSDVTFLLISLDSTDRAAENFLQKNGLTVPFGRDTFSQGRAAYNVTNIPQTFFLNARGEVVSKKIGALSKSALINAIGQLR